MRPLAAAACAALAFAAPAGAQAGVRNPFTEPAGEPPGFLVASAHAASHHRDGFGGALGVVPLPWLQVELSAAYRYETSIAGLVRLLPFPSSALTPFLGLGGNRAVTRLPGGLRYATFSAIATLGLQARVAERWFVGAELAGLYQVIDAAKVGSTRASLTPSDRFDFIPGAFVGAYFP